MLNTVRDIALQCPMCATWFQSRGVDETAAVAGTRTDFHKRVDGPDPLVYGVHLCPACGFAAVDGEFAQDAISAASEAVLTHGAQPALSEDIPASEKYERAAAIAERRGAGPLAVAELLLDAAWCCIAEQDAEAERFFRRRAAQAFASALARYDEVTRDRRVQLTYLVGELWRRAGDIAQARTWFDRVPEEITDGAPDAWLVALAVQQRDRPREWLG